MTPSAPPSPSVEIRRLSALNLKILAEPMRAVPIFSNPMQQQAHGHKFKNSKPATRKLVTPSASPSPSVEIQRLSALNGKILAGTMRAAPIFSNAKQTYGQKFKNSKPATSKLMTASATPPSVEILLLSALLGKVLAGPVRAAPIFLLPKYFLPK
ncbi:MAG: hypothetical protein V7K36_27485 [Nostoc sp.]